MKPARIEPSRIGMIAVCDTVLSVACAGTAGAPTELMLREYATSGAACALVVDGDILELGTCIADTTRDARGSNAKFSIDIASFIDEHPHVALYLYERGAGWRCLRKDGEPALV